MVVARHERESARDRLQPRGLRCQIELIIEVGTAHDARELFTPASFLGRRVAGWVGDRPWWRRDEELDRWSRRFLGAGTILLALAIVTGIHDAGLDHGDGSLFVLGLVDRYRNAFRFESSVSVHVLLSLAVAVLVAVRLVWRIRVAGTIGQRRFARPYAVLTILNLWALLGAACQSW